MERSKKRLKKSKGAKGLGKTKKILLLLGILAAACIATVIVLHTEEKKEQIKTTGDIILSVDPEAVRSLSWEYEDTSLSFLKEDDEWHWEDDEAFPVSKDKMEELLSVFEEFGAAFIIENVEDYSQYGLDAPTCTIRFATEEEEYEVLLGAYSTMDSQRYVSIGDGNAYLVTVDPFDYYEIAIEDTIQNDEFPYLENISAIEFSGDQDYSISYGTDSKASVCADDCYFTEIDGEKTPLDTDLVESYCSNISQMSTVKYVSYNVTDEELAEWGLDTPELTVTIAYTEIDEDKNETDKSFTLNIGRNQEELARKEEAEEKDKEYTDAVTSYARAGDSKIVYEIDETTFDTLYAASTDDLRHKEVVTADFGEVTKIDISLEGKECSLTIEDSELNDDGDYMALYKDEETAITDIRSSIKALSVNSFTDEEPKEKEEISFVLHLDNEDHPEMKVKIYRYDGTDCLVVLDGETLGLVSRSSVVNLIEAVNAIILNVE